MAEDKNKARNEAEKRRHTARKPGFENRPARPKKPAPKQGRGSPLDWLKTATTKDKLLVGGISGLVVLLLVLLLVVALRPPRSEVVAPSYDLAGSETERVLEVDSLPEKLDTAQYVGTVLPVTADAGMEYCEETLFLGDSNTERMMYYSDVTGVRLENCIGVASMGITTFKTNSCVRFEGHSKSYTMAQAVGILQPKRVVITFGTNNAGLNIDTFTSHYKDALDEIKREYPHADIIIGAVFPVDQYRQNTSITMKSIDKMNVALAALAKQEEVKYLNWHEAILDTEIGHSGFEYTLQDGVHLTRKGMDAIFTYFRTHAYITEDTRPSLKPVPKRVGVQPGIVTQDPYKVPGPIDWSKYEDSSSESSGSGSDSDISRSSSSKAPASSSSKAPSSSEVPSSSQPPASSSSSSEAPSSSSAASSSSEEQASSSVAPSSSSEEQAEPGGEAAATGGGPIGLGRWLQRMFGYK